jgi:putative heme iron utilization protein
VKKTQDQKKAEAVLTMNRLLTEYKTASLATTTPSGNPLVSYSPAAVDKDKNFYLFLTELSEHTGNLQTNPSVSLMLIEDEARTNQLFARNRLTISGKAEIIPRDGDQWTAASTIYRTAFGKFFDQLAQLGDFHMFKVTPDKARLVVGFGAAYDVKIPAWNSLELVTVK